MDPIIAQQIIDEWSEQKGLLPAPPVVNIDFDSDLFDKQRDFINDPAKRKAALCSRRAGKSRMASYYLMKSAYENPGSVNVFIAITRQSAKDIIWSYLLDINERYHLGANVRESILTIVLPNKSKIYLTGADNTKEIRKLLGNFFDLGIIDEAAELGQHLDKLIKEVLGPTLIDYDGTICVISTPGIVCDGIFYDITTDKLPNWSVHRWTMVENPKLPRKGWAEDPQAVMEVILEEEGIDKKSSLYTRQYLGQWVEGSEELVYGFINEVNTFKELPDKHFYYILGVDFGIVDPSAIIVGAYSYESRILYIVDEWKQNALSPEAVAHIVKKFNDKYKPVSIVVDGGGIGAAFVAQIQAMYSLPLEVSDKRDKVGFVSILDDEVKSGRVLIDEYMCKETITEIVNYRWADPIKKILPEVAEDHLMDAFLYLFRKSMHFHGREPDEKPKVTDSNYGEWLREQELQRVRDLEVEEWY